MPDTYEHLFVRNMMPCGSDFSNEGDAAGLPTPPNVSPPLGLMRVNEVPQSQIHMSHTWIHEVDEAHHWVNDHVHEYDEVLIWTGSDPENPEDLGAEIYLDIEGVRHNITTSGSVYIPAGVRHCPLGFIKVTRPFNFSALSLSPEYDSDENEGLMEKLKAEALATSESAS